MIAKYSLVAALVTLSLGETALAGACAAGFKQVTSAGGWRVECVNEEHRFPREMSEPGWGALGRNCTALRWNNTHDVEFDFSFFLTLENRHLEFPGAQRWEDNYYAAKRSVVVLTYQAPTSGPIKCYTSWGRVVGNERILRLVYQYN